MSGHTQGSWRVEDRGSRRNASAAFRWIKAPRETADDDDLSTVAFLHVGKFGGRTMDKVEANARLIAAAPDLLAALEKWLSHAEMNHGTFKSSKGDDVPLVKQTRDALDKANPR